MSAFHFSVRLCLLVAVLAFSPSRLAHARASDGELPAPLAAVHERARASLESGTVPAVVFDLDDTIFDSGSRTFAILAEFTRSAACAVDHPVPCARLAKVTRQEIRYELSDTLARAGIADPVFEAAAQAFWKARFFSNSYCDIDEPVTGAPAYVSSLGKLGARVIFLTGRDEPRMGDCTRRSLEKAGLSFGQLMLKPDPKLDDLAYKEEAFTEIRRQGPVIAAFENEPRNANAFLYAFPGALVIFLDTRHSNRPDRPDPSIPWIKDFSGNP